MPRKPFGAGLPRWASGKACPTKATPTITLWRRTFSAVSNVNGFTCANMAPAVLLRADIFAYIEAFYNTLRPHSAIDWLSPCAFELRLRNASAA